MASRLWQCESNHPESPYIDLFQRFADTNPLEFESPYETPEKTPKCNKLAEKFLQSGLREFRHRNWTDAMDEFNKSLRFVERISDNRVKIIYKRRAECFRAIGMNENAIIDLELADEEKLPSNTLLAHRKKEQLKHYQNKSTQTVGIENFPGLGECLKICDDSQYGRHLKAIRDIDVGETVLNERVLFAVAPNSESRCSNCFKHRRNFIPCPICTDAVFCDRMCWQKDQVHQMVCRTRFSLMGLQLKMQAQSILVALALFDRVEDLSHWVEEILTENLDDLPKSVSDDRSKYHFYLKLKHSNHLTENIQFVAWRVFMCLMDIPHIQTLFDTLHKQRFLQHFIALHCQINAANGFSDGRNRWICILTSLLNHSCAPNILWANVNDRSICIVIRPIRSGEQLFINYIGNVEQLKSERQQILYDNWQFWCDCERCQPIKKDAIQLDLLTDINFEQISRFRSCGVDESEKRILLKNCCAACLMKFGGRKWSFELGSVLSLYVSILMHELNTAHLK